MIAIDPGWGGGIAAKGYMGNVTLHEMPGTEGGVIELLAELRKSCGSTAYIEHVHAMPNNGCLGNFSLGRNVGALRAGLELAGYAVRTVPPRTWMKQIPNLPKGSGKGRTLRKKRIKEWVQAIWPGLHLTLKTSDAMAILEIGPTLGYEELIADWMD